MPIEHDIDHDQGHDLRPGCAKEFGKIEANMRTHSEFRTDIRNELAEIRSSMSDIPEIKQMLAEHIGQSGGGWKRIEDLEEGLEKLDNRMWGERLKTGAVVGAILMAIEFISSQVAALP